MPVSETLISALRALSSVPQLQPDELKQFSDSVKDECPLPDSSFGADPVWRLPNTVAPPVFFQSLIAQLRAASGLVARNGYIAVALKDVDLVFTEPSLREIIEDQAPTALTGAEHRLALQLLQGLDLKQAAVDDSTAYETKRSQFKSLASKLGLRGQSEVVRVLTTQVFQALAQMVHPSDQSDLDQYATKYLPKDVRRLTIVSPTGETIPVLDYGPVTGTPLVILHPMFFPPIGAADIAQAHDLNVRTLWPLRPGLIDQNAPVLNSKRHLERSVTGTIAVLDQIVGGPASILAFVSSGAVATRVAALRPEQVKSISFVATCYSAGRSTVSLPYFGAELVELAFRSEAIMTRTVAALRKYVSSDKRFRRMFENVFRASERDLSHVKSEFDGPDKGERLRLVTLQSPESIKHDFFNQTQFSWNELGDLSVPRKFMHGSDDSIHPPDKLAKILERIGEDALVVAPDMGHLPHFADLQDSIRFALTWRDETDADKVISNDTSAQI